MEKTLTFIAICLMAGVAVFLWWKMGQIWKVSQLERADRIAEDIKKIRQKPLFKQYFDLEDDAVKHFQGLHGIAEAFEVKQPEQPERLTPPEYVY